MTTTDDTPQQPPIDDDPERQIDLGRTLGERIRKVRREVGLSQGEFATRMGVSQNAIARWESDFAKPDDLAEPGGFPWRMEEEFGRLGVAKEWVLGWTDPAASYAKPKSGKKNHKPDDPAQPSEVDGENQSEPITQIRGFRSSADISALSTYDSLAMFSGIVTPSIN